MAKNEQQGLSIVTSPMVTTDPNPATQTYQDIDIIVPAGMVCEIHAIELTQTGIEADNAGDVSLIVEVHKNQTQVFAADRTSALSNDCIARGTMGTHADITANCAGVSENGMGYRAFPLPIMTAKGQLRLIAYAAIPTFCKVTARLYVNFVSVTQQRLLEVLGKE